MSWFQVFRTALRALIKNRMRSFLTALGVVIGVAAVIAMVAIGDGAKMRVEQSFESMGSNLIILMSGTSTVGGSRAGYGSQPTITWDDYRAIRTEVPSVQYTSPQLRSAAQVMGDDLNWGTMIYGVAPDFFLIRSWSPQQGTLFSQTEVDGGVKVAVLGQTVVEKLFGKGAKPVGRSIRIRNVPFEVVGVLEKKGQSPMGQDNDDAVYVPHTTFQSRIQGGLSKFVPGMVLIGGRPEAGATKAEEQVTALLRDRHHIDEGEDADFFVRNMAEVATASQEGTQTLTALLASIAAVSLLVGGIGIMNIMLVSVTERTREIGLRMAVGARPRDILAQFLVESLALSLVGGVIGIVLGLLIAGWVAAKFEWPMLIRPEVIGLAVGFSALVGVGFGLYPARKASRLDPIVALRFE